MGGALMSLGGLDIALGLILVVAGFEASPYRMGELERMSRIFLGASLAGSGLGVLALGYLIAAVDTIKEGVLRMSPPPQQMAADGTPSKKESFF